MMGNAKSSTADTSGSAAKVGQVSPHSIDAIRQHRIDIQMVQNVLLIWLDNKIDDNSPDCRNTITQLQCVVNTINTYTDGEECIHFLENMENDKACMIISGSLGQQIVPRVHNMSQVDSIFIFCDNMKHHEQWTKEWSKIKGVFTKIAPICEELKKAAQQCEQNAISISFVATSGDVSTKNLDQLNPSFMYTQIMKEVLLEIKFEQKHFIKFIEYCRTVFAKNQGELNNIKKFEQNYRNETPIWWYTCQCFLYPMLNRALRLMDTDIIIQMGFFIEDLHRHIEQLHKQQFEGQNSGQSFIVYRGQGMSKLEFEQMTKTKGGLISFNNFLSTSKNRTISLKFANNAVKNPDLVGVLFVMTINPTQSTTPFASIIDVSYFKREDEVLFSMHTIFRIGEITPMGENPRLFQVELTLTSDNDKDRRRLTDSIRQETNPEVEGWFRLGSVLMKLGQPGKAQQVYEILLEQATEEKIKAAIYHQIGCIKDDQEECNEAITFYEKSLEIYKKILPSNHSNLASCYNNIGEVYRKKSEYSKALSFQEKSLEIRQQLFPPNHSDLASSYGNIGLIYMHMGEYSNALSFLEKALPMQQQSLPPNHPDLANSYNNIGTMYFKMDEYSKAVSYYEKAVEIYKKSLPSNHPVLATSYSNLGLVYKKMGECSKALSSYEKALEIEQQSLSPNHSDLASTYGNIANVYLSMGEYSKACSYYEKAFEMKQQFLPPNHLSLGSASDAIGMLCEHMGDYSKAFSFYERAVEIGRKSLPLNHPDLQGFMGHLDRVKNKL